MHHLLQLQMAAITKLHAHFELRADLTYRKGGLKPLENNAPNSKGYVCVSYREDGIRQQIYLHRLKFFLKHGHLPERVDHRNESKGDNSLRNLRAATHSQNMMNITRKPRQGLPRSVYYQPNACRSRPYRANPRIDGRKVHLGFYETAEQASAAVENALRVAHGEFYRIQS